MIHPEVTAGEVVEDIYPLSPLQQGLLFHLLRDPLSPDYISQLVLRMHGVTPESVCAVWRLLAGRHPALRTGFVWDGLDDPVQVVYRVAPLPIEIHDLRGMTEAEREHRVDEFVTADRGRGFHPDEPPLARLTLLRLADDVVELVWTHHVIVMDGWSSGLLFDDLRRIETALAGRRPLPPYPGPSFRDYIARVIRRDPATDADHWREVLAGVESPTPLPLADRPGGNGTGGGAQHELWLSEEDSSRINAAARRLRLPFGVFAQGAWALTLSRYAGVDDVVFGMLVSGRTLDMPGVAEVVGALTNTVPVRIRLDPPRTSTVDGWLRELGRAHAATLAHEHSPLTEVVRSSAAAGGSSLFETVLVVQNYPVSPEAGRADLRITRVTGYESVHYPLVLFVIPGERIGVRIAYRKDVVTERSARLLAECVRNALAGLVDGEQHVDAVPVFATHTAVDTTLSDGPEREWLTSLTVPELFASAAASAPDAPAVVSAGDKAMSYKEIAEAADSLAVALARLGARVESKVGVLMERSSDSIVAMLGVMSAGAVYVPVDPAYPPARIGYMLADSDCEIIITRTGLRNLIPQENLASARVVCVDEPAAEPHDAHDPYPGHPRLAPDNLAYVIYTSGSTGAPKGVMVSHRAVLNTLLWMTEEFALGSGHVVAHKVPVGFTDALFEVLWPLCTGATVSVMDDSAVRDPDALAAALRSNRVTHAQLVPRQIEAIASTGRLRGLDPLPELTWVVNASESLPASFAEAWDEVCETARIHNIYGMTESAIFAVSQSMPRGMAARTGVAPIGLPIPNTTVRVLNPVLEPCPPGVAGELHLGGTGMARGYSGRPGLTAERFVPDPHGPPGARLYRTGDAGHWLPDGTGLEVLGRVDFQVKVRGLRVEPGEVEASLRRHPAVRDATVVGHDNRLDGYLVAEPGERVPSGAVREWLAGRLPEHLVPSTLTWLDDLPMTQHGKVDRRRLPQPEAARDVLGEPVPPRTEVERTLCELWTATLGVGHIGVHDDFFALGGDSLLAIRLVGRVREALMVDYTVAMVFDEPTVAGSAVRVTELMDAIGPQLGALLSELEDQTASTESP